MKVKIMGFRNFNTKKDNTPAMFIYYVTDEKVQNGSGCTVGQSYLGKQIPLQIGKEYDAVFTTSQNFDGTFRSQLTDLI